MTNDENSIPCARIATVAAKTRASVLAGQTVMVAVFDDTWGEFAKTCLGRVVQVEGETLVMRQQNARVTFALANSGVETRVTLPSGKTQVYRRATVGCEEIQ